MEEQNMHNPIAKELPHYYLIKQASNLDHEHGWTSNRASKRKERWIVQLLGVQIAFIAGISSR